MPIRSTVFTSLLIFVLLSRAVCAQSYGSASTLELVAAVGAVFYQARQKEPVMPDFVEEKIRRLGQEPIAAEEVNDEIEKPYYDEDGLGDQLPTLYGYTEGLDMRVKGKKASFKTLDQTSHQASHQIHKPSSRLSLLMREKNISQIDIQPGQLDIFPEGKLELPVSVILPFEGEPLMPVTGYDWLNQSEGLAFMRYQSMEAIAAIAEAALSLRAQERTVGLDDQSADINSDAEDQISLFEDLGGQLYTLEALPVYPPESVRVEEWHEIEGIIVELSFGVESIQVNITPNSEWKLPGAFEYSIKKINGGDNKKENDESCSSDDESEKSDAQNDARTPSENILEQAPSPEKQARDEALSKACEISETQLTPIKKTRPTRIEVSDYKERSVRQKECKAIYRCHNTLRFETKKDNRYFVSILDAHSTIELVKKHILEYLRVRLFVFKLYDPLFSGQNIILGCKGEGLLKSNFNLETNCIPVSFCLLKSLSLDDSLKAAGYEVCIYMVPNDMPYSMKFINPPESYIYVHGSHCYLVITNNQSNELILDATTSNYRNDCSFFLGTKEELRENLKYLLLRKKDNYKFHSSIFIDKFSCFLRFNSVDMSNFINYGAHNIDMATDVLFNTWYGMNMNPGS